MKNPRIALNISGLKSLEKASRSRSIVQNISANPTVFTNSNAELASAVTAINDFDKAATDAAGGDIYLVAIRNEKEDALDEAMRKLAGSVQNMPGLTQEIVFLAGLDLRKAGGNAAAPDFEVSQGSSPLHVKLRTKAQKKTFYNWEYCKDPQSSNSWVDALTTAESSTVITVPETGVYWFRVVYVQPSGETEHEAVRFAVN